MRSPCTLLGEDHWGKDMSEQLSIRDPLTAEKCCGQHRWGSEIDLRWSLDHEVERHREHRRKYAEVDDAVLSSDDESILSTPSSCMPSDYTSEGELGPDSDSDYWS